MNKKKLLGAILSGGITIIYFGLIFLLFFYHELTTKDIPLLTFIIMLIIIFIPLAGIVISLIFRINEIKSGEEDEAKKY